MEKLQHEIDRTDPDVAFRSNARYLHRTWARTFLSRPELYLKPQSLEEVQKIVNVARRCRRRLVVVGSAHSPSDLTCTSSWLINLDDFKRVLKVDKAKKTLLVQGGIRLRDLNKEANKYGLTMPNLGSIDEQSIAGAISTGTHGSSLKHGLLSQAVRSLRIVLSNGQAVRCSAEQNEELFRAALLSLGALGILAEVEFEMTAACNIEWEQTLKPLSEVLDTWSTTLWTQKEYTRVWWMPYSKRAVVWSADRTDKPEKAADAASWYGGAVGFHTYQNLLFLSNYIPPILPWIEWFIFGMQYGFKTGITTSAVEPLQTGLLMNCLFSQFVNEWAIPLHKGPEAIQRLSAWMNGEEGSGIPFSAKGLYVHCPIEVRVSDTSAARPRPYLDITASHGPTLFLNATLYRPYLQDPPCRWRYYEAFEWLMKDLGGRPHWAKNFSFADRDDIKTMYADSFPQWLEARDRADPQGMFLGEWHRRTLPIGDSYTHEEHEISRRKTANGGQFWTGRIRDEQSSSFQSRSGSPSASSSGESFDMLGSEAEKSILLESVDLDEGEADLTIKPLTHSHPKQTMTGIQVFDKM